VNDYTWQPRDGLLADYRDVYGPTTDAPLQFHDFTALALMAAIVGRRVWLRDGAINLYPNLFVVLLAPSSLYRKSTCISIGHDLGRAMEGRDESGASSRLLYPGQFTPESLLDILDEQPTGLLTIDEFRQFLDSMRRDYNSGLREMFMSLYDCRGIHRKIRSGEKRIEAPAVTMLSACATSWFTDAVKEKELQSGFYARLCYVTAWAKTRHQARGLAPDPSGRNHVMRQLARLRTAHGEMDLPPAAEDTFGAWSQQQQRAILGTDHEAYLAGFYTRLERVALKLSMLLELSRDPDSRTITPRSLGDAISLTTWLQGNIRRLFEHDFSFDADDAIRRKLAEAITKAPGIKRRDLMRKAHLDVRRFDPAIATLIQTEQIHLGDGGYHPGAPPPKAAKAPGEFDRWDECHQCGDVHVVGGACSIPRGRP
jgi:hypothetical protein